MSPTVVVVLLGACSTLFFFLGREAQSPGTERPRAMTELDRRFVTGAMRPFHKDVDEGGNIAMRPRAPPIAGEATENFIGQEPIAATVTNVSIIAVDLDDETLAFQGAELLRRCVECFASINSCTFLDRTAFDVLRYCQTGNHIVF
jgi:hypothetical protein